MTASKKNVWVLGGTGFIGKVLVNQLADNPRYLLNLLVHKSVSFRNLEPFNVFTGSLVDFDLAWMNKYPPDIIFHLARLGGSNFLTRSLAAQRGAKANSRLINFLTTLKKPPVVVYVSGSLMYGNQTFGKWADETTALSPVSYAKYYVAGEKPWMEAQQKGLLDIRFARPGWIVGNNSWFRIYYWNYYLQTGKVPLFGDGQQFMSLIHVDDCAGQILNLAEHGTQNQNLNIFAGAPVTQREFSGLMASLLHTEVDNIPVKKITQKLGKTITEALISSIPLRTKYPELANQYNQVYPHPEGMLSNVISVFKHHKSILTETP